jgi:acyl-CoA thioester hydrolase
VAGVPLYETAILPGWIDYNGHVRDAYYGLIASLAADALMDRLGMDAAYRARTGCTLYTVEMHVHYLHEVGRDERVAVSVQLLGADAKRMHAGFELRVAGRSDPVATVELMLLHVHQGATPATRPFPPEVAAAIRELAAAGAGQAFGPGSRAMGLAGRGPPA